MMWEVNAIPNGKDDISDDIAGPVLRVLNMLCATATAREKSAAITAAKKRYAAEHGIPFSQVRYNGK